MKRPYKAELENENRILRAAVKEFHWMARRYADGRQSYGTGMFNSHVRGLLKIGLDLRPVGDGTIWARDRGGRDYDLLTSQEATPGTPESLGKK